jgi:hypothetical protein
MVIWLRNRLISGHQGPQQPVHNPYFGEVGNIIQNPLVQQLGRQYFVDTIGPQ